MMHLLVFSLVGEREEEIIFNQNLLSRAEGKAYIWYGITNCLFVFNNQDKPP
jgi:hypothetical protein